MGVIATTDADPGPASRPSAAERRVREAALDCIARRGLSATTVDDIARTAGVSRATTYRLFPGGKDTIVDAVVGQEVHRFFADLGVELAGHDDPEAMLVAGVGRSLRFLTGHAALGAVLQHEPDLLVTPMATKRLGPVLDAAAAFATPHLRRFTTGPDADRRAAEVADLVVRLVLSYAMQPSAHLDPHDDASVARFVRAHLLPSLSTLPNP